MCKRTILSYLLLCIFFSLNSVASAQTLPPEAVNAAHRIQAVAVSDDKPLEAAEAFAKDLSIKLDLRAYVIHKDGWYKVLLGDFPDKPSVRKGLKLVKKKVKDAWAVIPDNDKIVAIWEKGRPVVFSQAETPLALASGPEVAAADVSGGLPRSAAEPEERPLKILSVGKNTPTTAAHSETRRQESEPEARNVDVFVTPTPLPGVTEEDLLGKPLEMPEKGAEIGMLEAVETPEKEHTPLMESFETAEVIIPTPIPKVSLTLPELPASSKGSVAPPDNAEPEGAPSKEPEKDADGLLLDIDDLQLDDVLGEPQDSGDTPLIGEELSPLLPEQEQHSPPERGQGDTFGDTETLEPTPNPSLRQAQGIAEEGSLTASPQEKFPQEGEATSTEAPRRAAPVVVKISARNERLVAVGFADGTLELWDLEAREVRFRQSAHAGRVCDLSFVFKKRHLVSVGIDGSFKVWSLKDGSEKAAVDLDISDIGDAKFDPANKRILVLHQNRLTAFKPSNRTSRQIFPAGEFFVLDEQPSGERDQLVCTPNADAALAFDLDCCSPVLFQQLTGGSEIGLPELFVTPLSAAAFAPKGDFFAVGYGKSEDFVPGKAHVEVYQFLSSGKKQALSVEFVLEVQAGLQHDVTSLAFSPKSSVLLAGHENGELQLFQLFSKLPSKTDSPPELAARAGKVLRDFKGHSARVAGLAFFSNGKRFVSISDDGTLRVWDVESAQELDRLEF